MTATEVGIRRALPSEAAPLAAVQDAALGNLAGHYEPESSWHGLLAEPGVYTYLAEAEEPFACVASGPVRVELFPGVPSGEIIMWYVHPAWQQQGYGRRLLVHGVTVLKRRQCDRALLWLPETAERASSVAARLGFEPAGSERVRNTAEAVIAEQAYSLDITRFF